jgi:hypothetical protein
MISAEQNQLMTRIGPSTPCGKLLRRYWQPVALADEMTGPRPVKASRRHFRKSTASSHPAAIPLRSRAT